MVIYSIKYFYFRIIELLLGCKVMLSNAVSWDMAAAEETVEIFSGGPERAP